MFRLLNKSAIWLLCQRINHCLWNLSKLPFTGTVLHCTSPSYPTVHPPAMGAGFAGGWSFGRLVISNIPKLFRCADSFTLATRIPSSGQR